jgi:hypothetical protein
VDVDRLAALAADATPGPWTATGYVGEDDDGRAVRDPNEGYAAVQAPGMAEDECVAMEALVADAAFIAAAREAVPALIQRVQRAEDVLDLLGGMWSWNQNGVPDSLAHTWFGRAGRILEEMVGRVAREPSARLTPVIAEWAAEAEPIQEGRPAR